MNTIKSIILLAIISVVSTNTNAQINMQEGFEYLETGKFEKAETFFVKIIKEYPNNKTAKLCYGRAIGLNGKPDKALTLFADMLNTYPGDVELQLNYNESLLWANKFEEAKPLYEQLVKENPDNFAAILGFANTLSNLKEYDDALLWINKALKLQTGNANAVLSRKYIKLGSAYQLSKKEKYEEAEQILLSIFEDFPNDKDTQLNLANLYLVSTESDKAIAVYQDLAITLEDSIRSLAGISLVYHIAEKDKTALHYAKLAKKQAIDTKQSSVKQIANERHVQALIWNRKFKTAELEIDSLSRFHDNEKWLLALEATLGMYKSEYEKSIKAYKQILVIDSTSFDGNLGKANALYAAGYVNSAYKAAFKTLDIFNEQKDAMAFIGKLNAQYSPYVQEQLAFTFDNGDNAAVWSNTTLYIPVNLKLTTFAWYKYRSTKNTTTKYAANSNTVGAGAEYALLPKLKLKGQLGVNMADADSVNYTQAVIEVLMALKPYKLQDLTLGYKREVQNFNAELIAQEIAMHNFIFTYNMGTNINLGWYTQMIHTQQTDDNTRNLLFTSLYYNLLRKPLLKTGINYQYMSFAKQVPSTYFSPEQYNALEWFVDSRGNIFENTEYISNFALGYQKVEKDPLTTLFRAELGITQHFSKRLSANIYGLYSNVASATASGFEYVEFGFKIKWQLSSLPLFYKNIERK